MQRYLLCLIALFLSSPVLAVEKLPLEKVDLNVLISETQKDVSQSNGTGLVWFMPEDVFFRLLTEGGAMPQEQASEIRSQLKGKCVIVMVRARVSPFGTFTFFDKSTVLDGTKIAVHKPDRKPVPMQQLEDIPPDIALLLNAMRPILANAIGRMGENMHFYVFSNATADGTKIYDPYKDEEAHISFAKMGRLPKAEFIQDTICDALFKPRLCKNGKHAHVTWKYDPWSGEKLPE